GNHTGQKTVKRVAKRSTAAKVTPEELKKKAEETTLSLSHWLKKQEEMEKMLIYHKGSRDPLVLPPKKTVEARKATPIKLPPLALKGIAWDETEPLALINDLVVKEGDTIQGAKIVKIDFDGIAVRYRAKKFVIKLIEWESKK
ncbi:unnamed protein product, partial [marine sediment metagenome]